MKDLTSYVYSFEEMIQGNFLYVDKTEYIWNLIRPSCAGYFLSRPRRIGKSLTLSTLKAVFEGKKELFKGLAIYAKEMYFLSRPRRFGKSLTLSTLKAVFEGKKELFKGLAIYDKPYDWKPYPIIHLSFTDYNATSDPVRELPDYLTEKVQRAAQEHSVVIQGSTPGLLFGSLIDELAKKTPVVQLFHVFFLN